jgi:uncharacterized LabA/DUF88 family protein
VHSPISGKSINFSKSKQAAFREAFFQELRKRRKVALRLGHLSDGKAWSFTADATKRLLRRQVSVDQLAESDVNYCTTQKGVDIRIGVDIASLAYKRLVQQIVLVSGDSDFVPAAKVARREGIDFVLDPMWNPISPSLFEHIDGLRSVCPRPQPKAIPPRNEATPNAKGHPPE